MSEERAVGIPGMPFALRYGATAVVLLLAYSIIVVTVYDFTTMTWRETYVGEGAAIACGLIYVLYEMGGGRFTDIFVEAILFWRKTCRAVRTIF